MTPAPHSPPIAAIVAVSHDSGDEIAGWLEAIERTGRRDRLELCLVDSGSAPEERERLQREFGSRVDHLLLEPNRGFGASCNRGAAATSAPVLIFTNPDTQLGTLPAGLEDGWPAGRLAGAMNHSLTPPAAHGARGMPTARRQALDLALGRFAPPVFVRDAVAPTWVSGSALAISREDFERDGRFPEDLFLYYEDLELCLAHADRGGQVVIDPEWAILHPPEAVGRPGRDSLDAIARQSGRRVAARRQGRAAAAALYVVLALLYVPRRAAGVLVRRRSAAAAATIALDLLFPSRVRRRLGAA